MRSPMAARLGRPVTWSCRAWKRSCSWSAILVLMSRWTLTKCVTAPLADRSGVMRSAFQKAEPSFR